MRYLLLLLALFPLTVFGHTRWFAESELIPMEPNESTYYYVGIWSIVMVVVVVLGVILESRSLLQFKFLNPNKPHVFERAASTFVMVVGAFFLIAGTHEYLFSPNLSYDLGIPLWLIVIQLFLGLAFLLGVTSRVGGIILALLWFAVIPYAGVVAALENFWVLSTSVFILLMGNEYFSITSFSFLRNLVAPFKRYALSLLRLGTGVTLMVLGLSEKIFAPEYGLHFLTVHQWNFMELLGLSYSDYLFTISAGSVEFILGLVLALGILTRFTSLVIAVIFFIPLFILGPIELAGHLPHFAAIVLLLLFGSGNHFTVFRNKDRHQA